MRCQGPQHRLRPLSRDRGGGMRVWFPWSNVHWRQRGAWLGVVLASAALLALWPQALGGATAFVVLQSNSMAPAFQRGDLVVVRAAAAYAPGDQVLYRGSNIAAIFHRIVGYDESGRFVLRGDANTYLDPDRPTTAEIIGRYWFAVPKIGGWLWAWRGPLLALTVALAWWLWAGPAPPARRDRRRGRRR